MILLKSRVIFQPPHPNCHLPQILMPKDPENQEVRLAP